MGCKLSGGSGVYGLGIGSKHSGVGMGFMGIGIGCKQSGCYRGIYGNECSPRNLGVGVVGFIGGCRVIIELVQWDYVGI